MNEFRYLDSARRLDEELLSDLRKSAVDTTVEDTYDSAEGGLARIVSGQTAFAGIEATKAAAEAGAVRAQLEHEASRALTDLMSNKQAAVLRFLENSEEEG